MDGVARFQRPLYMFLKFPIKFPLINKEISPFSLRPQERSIPPCSPKLGPYGNRRPSPQHYLVYPSGSPVEEPFHKMGVNIWSPSTEPHADGRPTYNWGVSWFPKGIVYDTATTTPVPCSPQHDTFHLGLGMGRPEPRQPACVKETLNRVSPPHLLPPLM